MTHAQPAVQQHFRRNRLRYTLAAGASLAALLVACGGGSSTSAPAAVLTLPRLAAATPGAFSGDCASLQAALASLPNTTVTLATTVAAGSLTVAGRSVAEHCRITGRSFDRVSAVDGKAYAIGFEMRLPKAWNGRFLHQGNGGTDGSVVTATGSTGGGPLTHALDKGFAVFSSDAGHSGAAPDFGADPQARLDYGYQTVGKMTPIAKEAIRRVYGKGPDRSYFAGCSNGGRHAMVTAARYGADYDGILVGAPGFNLPKAAVANLAGARLYQTAATVPVTDQISLATALNDTERRLIGNAVLTKCDALDGATDGLVQDTAACQAAFNLATDVPTCSGARDGTCLTSVQKTALAQIFAGPKTSNGTTIYASFPFDPGFGGGAAPSATGNPAGSGIGFWEFFASLNLDAGATGIIFKAPPEPVAGFAPVQFALSTNIDALFAGISATSGVYAESAMSFMTPPNPTRLDTLRDRGGKMMVYHGVADPIFSVNDTENWFKGLLADSGSLFAKFYRVPGMGHCSAGPATDQFDMLAPLMAWVEFGTEPAAVAASARGAGNAGGVNADVPAVWSPSRTRPLCPYPQVARYRGTGSLDDAANFACQ